MHELIVITVIIYERVAVGRKYLCTSFLDLLSMKATKILILMHPGPRN